MIVLASCTLLVPCCGRHESPPRALSAGEDSSMVAPDDTGALTLLMLSLLDRIKGKTHTLDPPSATGGYSRVLELWGGYV